MDKTITIIISTIVNFDPKIYIVAKKPRRARAAVITIRAITGSGPRHKQRASTPRFENTDIVAP